MYVHTQSKRTAPNNPLETKLDKQKEKQKQRETDGWRKGGVDEKGNGHNTPKLHLICEKKEKQEACQFQLSIYLFQFPHVPQTVRGIGSSFSVRLDTPLKGGL